MFFKLYDTKGEFLWDGVLVHFDEGKQKLFSKSHLSHISHASVSGIRLIVSLENLNFHDNYKSKI